MRSAVKRIGRPGPTDGKVPAVAAARIDRSSTLASVATATASMVRPSAKESPLERGQSDGWPCASEGETRAE